MMHMDEARKDSLHHSLGFNEYISNYSDKIIFILSDRHNSSCIKSTVNIHF